MTSLVLYIGNKNYSSWSFRPWIAMRMANIAFEEKLIPFGEANNNARFREFSPTGKVPVLMDGPIVVWESLAIIEYLAESYPMLWPHDPALRAEARSISAEMHAGFSALRRECPMNIRRRPAAMAITPDARRDVERIAEIWRGLRQRHAGPFLFGDCCAADAMFAPVVNRLTIYELVDDEAVLAYMGHVSALDAYREWEEAGRQEPWVVEEDEV